MRISIEGFKIAGAYSFISTMRRVFVRKDIRGFGFDATSAIAAPSWQATRTRQAVRGSCIGERTSPEQSCPKILDMAD